MHTIAILHPNHLKIIYFTSLKGSFTEIDRERGRIFPRLVHTPNCHSSWNWANLEPKARDFVLVPYTGAVVQALRPFLLLPQANELDQKQKYKGSNQHP